MGTIEDMEMQLAQAQKIKAISISSILQDWLCIDDTMGIGSGNLCISILYSLLITQMQPKGTKQP
jgi:hypothetical protein